MPATPERAEFVRKEFRVVKHENTAADTLYGSWARKTDEPIPSSLVYKDDAQAILNARPPLLNNGRRMSWAVGGEDVGMAMNYVGICPSAQVIDDERNLDRPSRIDEIQINFASDRTLLETWG